MPTHYLLTHNLQLYKLHLLEIVMAKALTTDDVIASVFSDCEESEFSDIFEGMQTNKIHDRL